jgi:UDPglucose 6-dehydrogenase
MKLAVIGSGYVGLVASACFSDMDHEVTCVDRDHARIASLQAGEVPIHEPGLAPLIMRNVQARRLSFGVGIEEAVVDAQFVVIAVGTPNGNDHRPDLSAVFSVARALSNALLGPCTIVIKSTVPVGTGDAIEKILGAHLPGATIDIVSNPEFLREGSAVHDFLNPDRIVVGTESERARAQMTQLYSVNHHGATPFVYTDRRSAELAKYACNAFLATKIAYINEVADMCERVDANVEHITRVMGLDHRIGREFLSVGPGYGGSCLPKDIRALAETARDWGMTATIAEATIAANDKRKEALIERIVTSCGGSVARREIAVFGLAFKANTDDMREAAALPLILALQSRGASVRAYDPAAMAEAGRLVEGVGFAANPYDCAKGAHALVILTDWPEFRHLDLAKVRATMAIPLIVDMRNMYEAAAMHAQGLAYVSVGRPAVWPTRDWCELADIQPRARIRSARQISVSAE